MHGIQSKPFDQQVSPLVDPEMTARGHNRRGAVFGNDGRAGIFFPYFQRVARLNCGKQFFPGEMDGTAVK
jgi:hypothetical protein